MVENLFADPGKVTRQLVDDLLKYKRLKGWMRPWPRSPPAAQGGAAAGGPDRCAEEARCPGPRVWGKEDKIIPAAHAGNAKGAKVEVIEGAGHMVQMEAAAKVNALIKEHLAKA